VSAFGFDFDDAFEFYSDLGGDFRASARRFELFADMGEWPDALGVERTRLNDAFPHVGSVMLMLLDYGDDWRFLVGVIKQSKREPKTRYPGTLESSASLPSSTRSTTTMRGTGRATAYVLPTEDYAFLVGWAADR
jgi:hypothetical protein